VIPRRLVRVVPEHTGEEAERYWRMAMALHPDWEFVTWRDPIDPAAFPLTSPYWGQCSSGAQLADLVRTEDIYTRGGIYLDSDVEVLRSFEPLLGVEAFAAWEDDEVVCNAVFGARPQHPALRRVLDLAVARRHEGTWGAGVGTFTEVLRGRRDVLLLPPGALYPYHYRQRRGLSPFWGGTEQARALLYQQSPWAFCAHHWRGSWVEEEAVNR